MSLYLITKSYDHLMPAFHWPLPLFQQQTFLLLRLLNIFCQSLQIFNYLPALLKNKKMKQKERGVHFKKLWGERTKLQYPNTRCLKRHHMYYLYTRCFSKHQLRSLNEDLKPFVLPVCCLLMRSYSLSVV